MTNHVEKMDFLSQIAAYREQITVRISDLITQLRSLQGRLLEELSALESEYRINNSTQVLTDGHTPSSKQLVLVWKEEMEELLISQFCNIVVIEKSTPVQKCSLSSISSLVTDLALNIHTSLSPTSDNNDSTNSRHSSSLYPEPNTDSLEPRNLPPKRTFRDKYSSITLPINSACAFGSGRSQLQGARGVAIQRVANRIYIADRGNNRVQVFSDTGKFVFDFTHAEMEGPKGICISENLERVYLTACDRNAVHCYSLDGYLLHNIGHSGSGQYQFNQPSGIAADAISKIYVCDFGNNRITVFTRELRYITILTHKVTKPTAIKVFQDLVYILDQRKLCVSAFTRGGAFITEIIPCGPEVYEVKHPYFFDVDMDGNFLITDLFNDCIKVFSSTGYYICQVGSSGEGEGQFIQPTGIALVESCVVTVCERAENQLQIFKMF